MPRLKPGEYHPPAERSPEQAKRLDELRARMDIRGHREAMEADEDQRIAAHNLYRLPPRPRIIK